MLILPGWLISSPLEAPRQGWGICIQDDLIIDLAEDTALRAKYPDHQVVKAPEAILAPGFVNAHSHLYGVLAHGIPLERAPSGFWPFLEEFWWPLVEDRLTSELINTSTEYRCAQMLDSGVTSFYDCTEAPMAIPGCLSAQAEVVRRWGLRGILSFEATQRINPENGQLGLEENRQFVEECQKVGGLLNGLICHHTTFTCSKDFIQQAAGMANDLGVALHAHVSEGTYEPEHCLREYGMRTLEYYRELGVADENLIASQCVQIEQNEIDLMAELGVRMTHMPLSNCEVGGGIAPVPQLVEAGVTVGLGSDGYIDDFFEVMRGAFLIHKAAHLDPRVMPADLVWYLATEGGARALGLEKVGRIEPGWQADLQLMEIDLPTPIRDHNLYEQLLLYGNASAVSSVWVAGNLKVYQREVIGADWEELKAHTREAADILWKA
jgi:cytosine/adenosine deaminase-related metal-dependent hydrolase